MPHQVLVIDGTSELKYSNNHLILKDYNDEEYEIFIEDLSLVLIYNNRLTITTYLLGQLAINNIGVVFFNEKYTPIYQLIPFYGSFNVSGNLLKQINWNENFKKYLWTYVVANKISNQQILLNKLYLDSSSSLVSYLNRLTIDDKYNVEATTAKIYFHRLFSNTFNRRNGDSINSLLNYTYSIILACINKNIVKYG